MELHPTQSCVMVNLNISPDKEQMLKFIWGDMSYGIEKLEFKIYATNTSERENNAYVNIELRNQLITQFILTFVICHQITFNKYRNSNSNKMKSSPNTIIH
jgi:hypothetical protein